MKTRPTAERIAAAARALLEREGAQAVSMRRVADATAISAMAIYRHFPNREALLHRVADDVFVELATSWERLKVPADPEKRLLRLVEGYLDYALAHPHLFDYAYSVRRDDARRFPDDFRARRSPTMNLVADTIADGMRLGRFREDDVWDVAMAVTAQAHGLICLYRAGRFGYGEARFRQFFRSTLGRLFDGIRA